MSVKFLELCVKSCTCLCIFLGRVHNFHQILRRLCRHTKMNPHLGLKGPGNVAQQWLCPFGILVSFSNSLLEIPGTGAPSIHIFVNQRQASSSELRSAGELPYSSWTERLVLSQEGKGTELYFWKLIYLIFKVKVKIVLRMRKEVPTTLDNNPCKLGGSHMKTTVVAGLKLRPALAPLEDQPRAQSNCMVHACCF